MIVVLNQQTGDTVVDYHYQIEISEESAILRRAWSWSLILILIVLLQDIILSKKHIAKAKNVVTVVKYMHTRLVS